MLPVAIKSIQSAGEPLRQQSNLQIKIGQKITGWSKFNDELKRLCASKSTIMDYTGIFQLLIEAIIVFFLAVFENIKNCLKWGFVPYYSKWRNTQPHSYAGVLLWPSWRLACGAILACLYHLISSHLAGLHLKSMFSSVKQWWTFSFQHGTTKAQWSSKLKQKDDDKYSSSNCQQQKECAEVEPNQWNTSGWK